MFYFLIATISGVLALLLTGYMALYIVRQDEGTAKMKEIAAAVREGAMAFLGREYRVLAIFVVVVAIILGIMPGLGWWAAASFILGAASSGLTGFLGMSVAVRSNSRAAAAVQKSLSRGLGVAFRGGAVMGMSIVGIGIIGLSIVYFLFSRERNFMTIIAAYGMGASGVALFARVGGGIYTKAADAGSDLVGKVEAGIPEDDPRNAGVIADLVGDNVGDCAGAGADLFESYVESIIAVITLSGVAVLAGSVGKALVPDEPTAWYLPMMVAAGGIIASIIGIFLVRSGEKADMGALLNALRRGTYTASVLATVFAFLAVYLLGVNLNVFWAILAGLIAGVIIGEAANYYTSYAYKPTAQVAGAAQTGAATLIIAGFANGLMSTVPTVIFVAIAVVVAYRFAGMYGVAIAGVGMLSTLGIVDATDAYGPIADNAGGIAEMSGLPHEVRDKTDALDAMGNTTKATGKGFAVGSAALTALALILAYTQAANIKFEQLSLLDARLIAGLFLGAMLPAVFAALTMAAVGRTAMSIVNEVRRQFREIKGLMEGKAKPEYARCVDICTRDALREMITPSIITVIAPVIVSLLLGPVALAGFLAGATASGFILGITLANAGGSWDNAKKFIESGQFGGKGSDAHKAAVVGDAVGDPMKDTSGPSLNIMIKLMTVISLVLAPVLSRFPGII
ncbi:MAG: sodium-translocating pyrophosphatase [Chloroflexota bacterium]